MTASGARAVLWDLDGTLADTAEHHFAAWAATLGPRGVELTPDAFRRTFGRQNRDVLRDLLGDELSSEEIGRIGAAKEADYRARVLAGQLVTLPGVDDWLARLRQDGWQQAIASSAPRANIRAILEALSLQDAFDAIAGEEDARRGKPDPTIFLAAAEKLGVPPRRCIVVEDAAAGVEAARRAGMRSIGVRADSRLDADLAVASLQDVPADAFDRLLERPAAPGPRR